MSKRYEYTAFITRGESAGHKTFPTYKEAREYLAPHEEISPVLIVQRCLTGKNRGSDWIVYQPYFKGDQNA